MVLVVWVPPGRLELYERTMLGCMVLVFFGGDNGIVVTETARNTGLLAVSCISGYILTPRMCRRVVRQIWVLCWGTLSSSQEIWGTHGLGRCGVCNNVVMT